MTTEEILAAALKLPAEVRSELADRLLASLEEAEEQLSPEEREKLWTEEAERRSREMDEGKVKGIPLDEVLADAHELLK
jgi:hypothetical protein